MGRSGNSAETAPTERVLPSRSEMWKRMAWLSGLGGPPIAVLPQCTGGLLTSSRVSLEWLESYPRRFSCSPRSCSPPPSYTSLLHVLARLDVLARLERLALLLLELSLIFGPTCLPFGLLALLRVKRPDDSSGCSGRCESRPCVRGRWACYPWHVQPTRPFSLVTRKPREKLKRLAWGNQGQMRRWMLLQVAVEQGKDGYLLHSLIHINIGFLSIIHDCYTGLGYPEGAGHLVPSPGCCSCLYRRTKGV